MATNCASTAPTTVTQRIEDLGFGWYQTHVVVLCMGVMMVEGAVLMSVSALTEAVSNEFGIADEVGKSSLTSCAFVGLAVGTLASGPIGNIWGRRWPILVGYLGITIVSLCAYLFHTRAGLYLTNTLLGAFAGVGIPMGAIAVAEVSPKSLRGLSYAALSMAFGCGDIWASAGLRMVMPDLLRGDEHKLFLWIMSLSCSFLLLGLLSPVSRYDSPCFLAASGNKEAATGALNLIAEMNGKQHLQHLSPHQLQHVSETHGHVSFREAVRVMARSPTLRTHACVMALLFFGRDFTLFGMGVFWPLAWEHAAQLHVVDMYAATQMLIGAVLGLVGFAFASVLVWKLPRLHSITVGGLMCAVSIRYVVALEQGERWGLTGVVLFKFFFPAASMVCGLLPSELFPAEIRAWGYASVAFAGRVASMLAPFAVEHSHQGFLFAVFVFGASVGPLAHLFLPETKDAELKSLETDSDVRCVDCFVEKRLAAYGSLAGKLPKAV